MLRLTLTAIAFLISTIPTFSQDTFWTKSHPIIEKVLLSKNEGFTYQQNDAYLFEDIIDLKLGHKKNWGIRLLKSSNNLFAIINGSGQVYKLGPLKGDSVFVSKIDKTVYFGHNFKAINISYKGELYSFGGNGFWRRNGHLRKYNQIKKEWDIVPLNTEIPVFHHIAYFDTATGKLYYAAMSHIDYATNKKVELNKWYSLDLNTYQNIEIGSINRELRKLIPEEPFSLSFNAYTLTPFQGVIITDRFDKHFFIHFPSLNAYPINNEKIRQALKARSNHLSETFFYIDSILFLGLQSSLIDSIKIEKIFYDTTKGISIIENNYAKLIYIAIGFALLSFLAVFILYRKRKKAVEIASEIEETPIISYEPIEESLIELLKTNLENGITIPEVNDLLGLTKKPLSIQKKNRNEVILHINTKFKLKSGSEEDLIIRKRDENDKRSFIYFLNQDVEVNG